MTRPEGRPAQIPTPRGTSHVHLPPLPATTQARSQSGRAGLLYQGVQELPAGLLAAPAGLGADPAVRHVDMPLALVAAAPADSHAGLQQRPGEARVVVRLAANDRRGGGADIDAVQAQPDARDHLGNVPLAQVGSGVRVASLGAVVKRVDG